VGGREKPGMADDPELVGNAEARTSTTTRTKNRNDEGMAMGALYLFVPPDGCGGLGSPGKTPTPNVGVDLAGAVHDALAQNLSLPGSNSPKLA
jgi:hypothetical protein